MTEAAATQPENAEMSEEQMDQFFENQGEQPVAKEEPEAPEEATEAATEEPEQEAPEEKYVPLGALHEERAKRKELSAKIQKMEERWAQMLDRMQQPREEQPQIPEFQENPAGNLDARLAQFERWQREQEQRAKQSQQMQEQHQRWNQMLSNYQSAAQSYAQEHPEFSEAYAFWAKGRLSELQAAGYSLEQAQHVMGQEEAAIVVRAMESEENPAERMFRLAKARGWGAQPRDESGKFKALEKGGKVKNLSKGGGTPPPPDSLEALASIEDDEEFDRVWKKLVGPN